MPLFPGVDYLTQLVLGPLTVNDNQASPTTLFILGAPINAVIEFSVVRGTITAIGRFLLSTNGTIISLEQDGTSAALTGIAFSAALSGGSAQIQYTSTSTGQPAQFYYTTRNITSI
jgi:hypothetical protein